MKKKKVPINYASRDFNSLKVDFVEHAKRYYSETFKDFGDGSFGSLMLDAVAYTGDILSFYLDYQVNESFLSTAMETPNIVRLAQQMGYRHSYASSATGEVRLYFIIPAGTTGLGPNETYLPKVIRGSSFRSATGGSYFLTEDIDLADDVHDIVAARVDESTGLPISYAVRAIGQVMSGEFRVESFPVGAFERFRSVTLENSNIVEIMTVVDSEGNEYFEVDNLSQDVIYKEVPNPNTKTDGVKSILKPFAATRRFVVNNGALFTTLTFGHGSFEEIDAPSIADPGDVILDMKGKKHISSTTFDPMKLIQNDKFGVAPANTTIDVVTRINTTSTVNCRVGELSSIGDLELEFPDPNVVPSSVISAIVNSSEVYNDEPIIGDTEELSLDEIRIRANDIFASQDRAVTRLDYEAMVYSMPSKFGSAHRCAIYRDTDSRRRNLNLYVMSIDSDGFLMPPNSLTKKNIKTWLSSRKMIADTIDILDAKIVNLEVYFEIIHDAYADRNIVLSACNDQLRHEFRSKFFIGENFSISRVYKALNCVTGVTDVKKVVVRRKIGSDYSSTNFNIEVNTSMDGREVMAAKNVIFEIKNFNTDFIGVVR